MLIINQLIKVMREMNGLSQAEIATDCGTNQSSLARFENGRIKLQSDMVDQIAAKLSINPKFYENSAESLFNTASGELIKLIIPENRVTMNLDMSFFVDVLAETSKLLEVIFLIPEEGRLTRIACPFDIPIYSIAVRDNHSNVFLFRRRTASDLLATITKVNELQASITERAKRENNVATFSYRRIETALYKKIRAWVQVERQDIVPLFDANKDFLILSEEEATLIHDIRAGHYRIKEIRNNLQPHRKTKL